jgi:hypothetical protein
VSCWPMQPRVSVMRCNAVSKHSAQRIVAKHQVMP